MVKKFVSQAFFDPSRRTDETPSPQIAKHSDQNRNAHDVKGVDEKDNHIDPVSSEIVDRPFYDSGNKKLQKIHRNQTGKTQ